MQSINTSNRTCPEIPRNYTEDNFDEDIMTSSEPVYPASALASRNRFCRLCLKKSSSFLLPLVAKIETVTVMEMLLMVTGVELEANPLFPTKICSNCMTKLDFAYNVRQEFLNGTELLLKMAVENRLAGYYAQFEPVVGSYTDEVLKESRNVLETTKAEIEEINCNVSREGEGVLPEETVDEETDNQKVEIIEFEQYECLEDELGDSSIPDEPVEGLTDSVKIKNEDLENELMKVAILETDGPSMQNTDTTPVKSEKFVYSWKDLVKPKSRKKERPKNDLSGINRNAKADANLLAQFPQTTCYICDTAHDSLEQRDEHFNVHIEMVPHRCETCSTNDEPVISKSVITLNRHRLMHRLPYKCTKCYRRFISSGSQYTHIWSTHMSGTEGLTCDYCGKTFNQKRSFQAHVRRHRYKANGKYRCDVCGETCGSSILLTRHKRKHTGEKNFACPYCPKRFSRACNLLTHKRIHTNERCHRCEDCGRSFRDSVTLRKHQERFHMGRTPALRADRNPFVIAPDGRKLFQCVKEGCRYETYSGTAISRHKARHSKRYACGDCGKRFAEPNLVRRHQTAMHLGDKKDQAQTEQHHGAQQGQGDNAEFGLQLSQSGQECKIEEADDVTFSITLSDK
ncbi:zinc finger protein 675-like isoform X1 [Armigeres subalbatus]|uniref:zinc finger protein 675-like isoform X1 n=2 Tax=Armigeres subalbatus TaxID=124917 RepID=UPI002ECFE1A8